MAEKPNGILKHFLRDKKSAPAAAQEEASPAVPLESLSDPEQTGAQPADTSASEPAAPKPKKQRVFAYTSDPLQTLYNHWLTETDEDGVSEDIAEYMSTHAYRVENDTEYNFEVNVKRFFMHARILAKKRLSDYTSGTQLLEKSGKDTGTYSADADAIFYLTPDNMMLLVAALPPIGNGAHIQLNQLTSHLHTLGVRNGVIDKVLRKIILEKSYFTIFPLALGTLSTPGKNGEIIERVPREAEVTFNETDFGNVDFASRNFLREISKGDVICDIVPPEKGTDGLDLLGRVIPAKEGKPAYIPQGTNTVVSEDRTCLLAAIDGYITFRSGTFRVIQVLDIHGNVDFSVGNIKYHGGVIIHGDVLNGFEIQAEGDVVVHGVVEAARITSGGNIIIHNGMNGNFEGELNAKGDIHSPFLENTLVSSGGDVHTGSLICCDVFCDGTIYANTKMGIVIGGSLTAMHAIKARIIGNKAGRKTELTLGTLPHAVREKDGLEKYAKTVDETMELLQKNISYLQSIEHLPEQKAQVLKQLEDQYQLYTSQKASLLQRHETILQQLDLVDEAVIECRTIYPITSITISGVTKKITEVTKNAKIALSEEGDIKIYPLH